MKKIVLLQHHHTITELKNNLDILLSMVDQNLKQLHLQQQDVQWHI